MKKMAELDAKVAEKVFGLNVTWTKHEATESQWPLVGDSKKHPDPYTKDATADYRVLKHVRENWDDMKQTRFVDIYENMMIERAGTSYFHALLYQPGDYSRAALKALGETI